MGIYLGIKDKARKVISSYIGVNNIARRIIKAYIGIGGIARPLLSKEEKISYYGRIADLPSKTSCRSGTSIGNHALFQLDNEIITYNEKLTQGTVEKLQESGRVGGVGSIGDNHVIYIGGGSAKQYKCVDSYDKNLTHKILANCSTSYGSAPMSASFDNKVIFAGGGPPAPSTYDSLEVYNESLTESRPDIKLSSQKTAGAGITLGDYALFAGGWYYLSYKQFETDTVDVFNKALTRNAVEPLCKGRAHVAYASTGEHILILGGSSYNPEKIFDYIDIYDKSFTHGFTTSYNAKKFAAGLSINGYAMFAGGSCDTKNTALNTVEIYDKSLAREIMSLEAPKYNLKTASIGDYALFAGEADHTVEVFVAKEGTIGTEPIEIQHGAIKEEKPVQSTSIKKKTTKNLGNPRKSLTATSIGNYALFAGGNKNNQDCSYVEALSSSMSLVSCASLSIGASDMSSTTVGSYALFAGGKWSGTNISSYSKPIEAYNSSLSRTTGSAIEGYCMSATTIGNYALFAGGLKCKSDANNPTGTLQDTVTAFNSSLSKTNVTPLSGRLAYGTATSVGDYAIFSGGEKALRYSMYDHTDVYNKSLTKIAIVEELVKLTERTAASIGNYALFFGGTTSPTGSGATNTVDGYNSSLTRVTAENLTYAGYGRKAVSLKKNIVVAGGFVTDKNGEYSPIVDVYSASLVKTISDDLSVGRALHAGTAVGNYAAFAGGSGKSGLVANIDIYEEL